MKTIQAIRHTDKAGIHASQAGLDRFRSEVIVRDPFQITDVFCGTGYSRTTETILAAVIYQGIAPERLHASIDLLGTPQMDEAFDEGFVKVYEEAGDALAATKAYFTVDVYQQLLETLQSGLRQAFDSMPEGGYGLLVGHRPFLEMLADACGTESVKELKTCEGFIFTLTSGVMKAEKA